MFLFSPEIGRNFSNTTLSAIKYCFWFSINCFIFQFFSSSVSFWFVVVVFLIFFFFLVSLKIKSRVWFIHNKKLNGKIIECMYRVRIIITLFHIIILYAHSSSCNTCSLNPYDGKHIPSVPSGLMQNSIASNSVGSYGTMP